MKITTRLNPLSFFIFAFLQIFILQKVWGAGFASQAQVFQNYGQVPLRFEPNFGQTDPLVRYITRGNGYAMYFMPTEIALALDVSTNPVLSRHRPLSSFSTYSKGRQFRLIHLTLVGANTNAVISSEQTLPEKVNYFIGNDPSRWQRNLSVFGRVHYQDIYPGIDLTFYGNQSQLEYDFVVAPKVDTQKIELNLTGAENVEIETNGDLAFSVQGRATRFHRPVIYQSINGIRHDIAGNYRLQGNTVGFEIGAYDQSLPLVVDPVLSYSTFLGLMTNVENITTNTVLDAAGYTITLSGGNSSQIFIVSNGASLTLNNLTIANGFTTTNAGAIYNGGILMASNCVFNANNATGTNGLSPTNCVH
jgi:hypothetical protein